MLRADRSTTPAATALSLAELTMLRDRSTTLAQVEGVVIVNGNLGAPDEQKPMERVTAASATYARTPRARAGRQIRAGRRSGTPSATARYRRAHPRAARRRRLLFEVRPTDPSTLAAVAALLLSVALVACYVPARRAGRMPVASALRAE